MKKFVTLMSLIALCGSLSAFAAGTKAEHVLDRIAPVMMSLKGANSIGVGQCYRGTAKEIRPGTLPTSEDCIQVGFVTAQEAKRAEAAFKTPLSVDGVYVGFKLVGEIRPE